MQFLQLNKKGHCVNEVKIFDVYKGNVNDNELNDKQQEMKISSHK